MGSADLAAKAAFYGVMVCWWGFALTFWLRKRPPRARATRRDPTSYLGLLLQAIGYFIVWFRPLRHRQLSAVASGPEWAAWMMAAVSVAIAVGSVGLVIWAARCLGKQWSLGARLVQDHDLIQEGPYRFVRHPIYTGMLGLLVATGLATTGWIPLLVAIVVFAAGTWLRIRIEERLLRQAFGEQFDEYARRVRAVIPGIY